MTCSAANLWLYETAWRMSSKRAVYNGYDADVMEHSGLINGMTGDLRHENANAMRIFLNAFARFRVWLRSVQSDAVRSNSGRCICTAEEVLFRFCPPGPVAFVKVILHTDDS